MPQETLTSQIKTVKQSGKRRAEQPIGKEISGKIHQDSDIRVEEEEQLLRVNVDYSLDINYEHVSDCSITVSVRPRG